MSFDNPVRLKMYFFIRKEYPLKVFRDFLLFLNLVKINKTIVLSFKFENIHVLYNNIELP